MEIICINDKFSAEQIAVIPNRPVEGNIYTWRARRKTREGKIGIMLHEIINPEIPGVAGMMFEPAFNVKRFTTLSGEVVTMAMVREWSRISKYENHE